MALHVSGTGIDTSTGKASSDQNIGKAKREMNEGSMGTLRATKKIAEIAQGEDNPYEQPHTSTFGKVTNGEETFLRWLSDRSEGKSDINVTT